MLAQWLVNVQYSGSVADYYTLPEQYLWAKIAVAAGAPRSEADYISLPKQYVWKAIYDAVSGSSLGTIDWTEKQALGHIAAAYRGDTGTPENLATYIDWPWRYQVASIIVHTAIDSDVLTFVAASGATDIAGLDAFVKGVKDLGLWNSMVAWPLRSSQNAGIGTTAYSLGGLGTFNGTLVSGPTWAADGVENTAANSINFGNPFASTRAFVHVFAKTDIADNNGASLASYSSGPEKGYEILFSVANAPQIRFYAGDFQNNARTPSINCNDGNQHFVSGITDGSSAQWFVDGSAGSFSALTHTPLAAPTTSLIVGGRSNGSVSVACRSAFVAVFTTYTAQMSQVYTLYKTTLGLGLSLP
jgi:hypothetical protein